MKFEEYYELLELGSGDRVLVTGDNSLFLALYIAGRAREEGKEVITRALLGPGSKAISIREALEHEKESYSEYYQTLKKGIVNTSFGRHGLLEQIPTTLFSRVVLEYEKWDFTVFADHLKKLYELCSDDAVLVIKDGLDVFRMLKEKEKKVFRTVEAPLSFREYLNKMGLEVLLQDLKEGDGIIKARIGLKLKQAPKNFSIMPEKEWAENIVAGVGQVALACTPANFVIKKDDYYHVIVMSPRRDNKAVYRVKFLDWEQTIVREVPELFAKNILIVVLPVIPEFDKEIQEKGLIIVSPEKALQLFRQR